MRLHLSLRARPYLPFVLALLLGCVVLAAPSPASAAISSCRGDPLVWLSDGATIQLSVTAATDAAAVDRITYTLHVPAGSQATKIVYTGGALAGKEQVVVKADQKAGTYTTETLVVTPRQSVSVTAVSRVDATQQSASGLSNRAIILAFATDGTLQ